MDNIHIRPADPVYDTTCDECDAPANIVVVGRYERGCHYCGNAIALCFTHAMALTVELHERLHAELRAVADQCKGGLTP